MGGHTSLIYGLIILAGAILIVPLFKRFRMSPILGYLVTGMVIGPYGFGLVPDGENIRLLAEFGVLFLLFMIGLELPLDRLRAMRRYVFGLGSSQVIVTALILIGLAVWWGEPVGAAVVIGFGLALSSTATVLGELSERSELVMRFGRVSLAVLLMQDLAVAPLLAMVPLLGDQAPEGHALLIRAAEGLGALLLVVFLGRFVFRPVFSVVVSAKMPELFTATSLFLVVGTSFLTAEAGLSMPLGAFLAGILLADTEYRHQVEADIYPFRGLFLGLFFMTVGMSIQGTLLLNHAPLILGLLLVLILIKVFVTTIACRLFSLRWDVALRTGLTLAQGGEFAFVLIGLAVVEGVVSSFPAQIIFLVVALGIVATPFLIALGELAGNWLQQYVDVEPATLDHEAQDLRNHVVIAGFGRVGQTVADLLEQLDIPYVALDLDRNVVADARRSGKPVYYGNASSAQVLEAAGVGKAKVAVVTLDAHHLAQSLITLLRKRWPDLPIYSRARDLAFSEQLENAGATEAIPENIEASLRLGSRVLRAIGMPRDQVQELLEILTAEDYRLLREHVHCVETDGRTKQQLSEFSRRNQGDGD
ncbi:monovalent cation:proton antiporter-2 (CPA2) family protein [Aestuariispira ectoiniformans]|uniref:monovalent cation:proton antiporter-2 (CPA2) family protein n=1 Tax=Aestuariispira ectoiniformans TaxID=2775080 RepID=UPI0021E37A62|nr:monovalent cation:proton antiporter-2 (CPA2) family protein [Aestuariispira ectoiniformans]